MDNPEEHITGRLGLTQLRGALEPLGWTLAETVDYGIDIQVEVFREHKTTGITFGLQLKSSRSTDYSSAGDFIAQTLKVKNARYLIQEMQIPTILVHANVESGRTYWTAPQLDGEVAQRLVGRSDDATLTLRIPTENCPLTCYLKPSAERRSFLRPGQSLARHRSTSSPHCAISQIPTARSGSCSGPMPLSTSTGITVDGLPHFPTRRPTTPHQEGDSMTRQRNDGRRMIR